MTDASQEDSFYTYRCVPFKYADSRKSLGILFFVNKFLTHFYIAIIFTFHNEDMQFQLIKILFVPEIQYADY